MLDYIILILIYCHYIYHSCTENNISSSNAIKTSIRITKSHKSFFIYIKPPEKSFYHTENLVFTNWIQWTHITVYFYTELMIHSLKEKWRHFDLKSLVTDGTKIRPGIPSNWRIFESNWVKLCLSISSQFDSNILQLLGIPDRISVPPVTQFFRSKWLHFSFSVGYWLQPLYITKRFNDCGCYNYWCHGFGNPSQWLCIKQVPPINYCDKCIFSQPIYCIDIAAQTRRFIPTGSHRKAFFELREITCFSLISYVNKKLVSRYLCK